jgi:hypothetical protein
MDTLPILSEKAPGKGALVPRSTMLRDPAIHSFAMHPRRSSSLTFKVSSSEAGNQSHPWDMDTCCPLCMVQGTGKDAVTDSFDV